MTGNLYINGDIGKYTASDGEEIDGVVLLDIIQQVKKYPDAERFKLHINTLGGSIYEGKRIKEYLESLGKPIDTYGYNVVASMGTDIFLLGEKRELKKGTDFFIHLPQGGVHGDSEHIMDYAKEMADLKKEMLDNYIQATGLNQEALMPLLIDETTLTTEQAYSLGFANSQPLAVEPIAYFNTNINNNNMNLTAEDKSWIDKQFEGISNSLSKIFKSTPKNVMETAADGETMIDFPDIEEGQPISIGAKAMVDGSPAEGEYVMPSGNTFVFVAGELTEIRESEAKEEGAEGDAEMLAFIEDLKKQLTVSKDEFATAKKENETIKKELVAVNKEKQTLITQVSNIKSQQEKFQKELKTKFDFTAKKEGEKEADTGIEKNDAKNALETIRNKRKNK
jgi:ATP-dependent protease ClpP protease subunit